MSYLKWIFKSQFHHWRTNLPLLLGILFTSSILTGALVVGDSVRYTLKEFLLHRLGKIEYVVNSGDRYMERRLAEDLSKDTGITSVPAYLQEGIAVKDGGKLRVNGVRVTGTGPDFWKLGRGGSPPKSLDRGEVYLNETLAARLDVKSGDSFLLRMQPVSFIPYDMPFAVGREKTIGINVKIKGILGDEEFGNFNLNSGQVFPLNLFISLDFLQEELDLEDKINYIFTTGKKKIDLHQAVGRNMKLEDAGLSLVHRKKSNFFELLSDRVFIDPAISGIALEAGGTPSGALTYFVNRLSSGAETTPYSFVAAGGIPGRDLKDYEVIINEWLSADLEAFPGDELTIHYYVTGHDDELIEESRVFKIKSVVPVTSKIGERFLMPDFPGLAEMDNCRDWDPGIPIDPDSIRDKDEDYWDRFRGTPKAYIALETAQKIWDTRFGNLTVVRYYNPPGLELSPGRAKAELEQHILTNLNPALAGIEIRSVMEEGLTGAENSVDFGGLFLGLSFFLILSALMLTGLLFLFNLEQDRSEIGLLLSLGYTRRLTRFLFIARAAVIAFTGAAAGIIPGIIYNNLILGALGSAWNDAVNSVYLLSYVKPGTLAAAASVSFIMAVITIYFFSTKLFRQPLNALLRSTGSVNVGRKKIRNTGLIIFIICMAFVFLMVIYSIIFIPPQAEGLFFGAGGLSLVGLLSLFHWTLTRIHGGKSFKRINLFFLAVENLARRRKRSLLAAGLLACAFFMVIAVGLNKKSLSSSVFHNTAATGGYELYGELSIPLLHNPGTTEGRKKAGLDEVLPGGTGFLALRANDGEDASCLNLNLVETPRLMGVNPGPLAAKNAFSFTTLSKKTGTKSPWELLNEPIGEDVIPGFADDTVITWGMGKKVGDTIDYISEQGKKFKIQLVGALNNTIFQGNILIAEKEFLKYFPSHSGYQVFLVDLPQKADPGEMKVQLSGHLRNRGAILQQTDHRLAEFNKVENTYLSVFLILGGLGIITGTIGLGIVLLRKVMESRKELALLRAVGFRRESIYYLVAVEHIIILLGGLFCGALSAIIAVFPYITAHPDRIPTDFIIFLVAGILLNGLLWIGTMTFGLLRGKIITALRND